ncbi:MAG: DUF2510 domain-containing protein [Actinomycetia bacterium]|nr:DUF2510 domain-containing protein [Actinomycetes bacterium]
MAEPGWYDSPDGNGTLRWWDGAQWTEYAHPRPTGQSAPEQSEPLFEGQAEPAETMPQYDPVLAAQTSGAARKNKASLILALVAVAAVLFIGLGFWAVSAIISSSSGTDIRTAVSNLFGTNPETATQDFQEGLNNADLYDQDAVAQLNPAFINAKVDLTDDSTVTTPTVEKSGNSYHYKDAYFALEATGKGDGEDTGALSYRFGSYSWHATTDIDAPTYSDIEIRRDSQADEYSNLGSIESIAIGLYPASSKSDKATIIDSGVIKIYGQDYAFIRWKTGSADYSWEQICLGRRLNDVGVEIHVMMDGTSKSTSDVLKGFGLK